MERYEMERKNFIKKKKKKKVDRFNLFLGSNKKQRIPIRIQGCKNQQKKKIFIAFLDPDADPDSEYGSGSTIQLGSGSEALVITTATCSFLTLWSFHLCCMKYVYALLRIRIRDPVSF
jgi:hypothetical protein